MHLKMPTDAENCVKIVRSSWKMDIFGGPIPELGLVECFRVFFEDIYEKVNVGSVKIAGCY